MSDITHYKAPFSFDTIARNVLLATIFLLPLFFLPISFLSLQQAKLSLLALGVFISAICFLIERIRRSSFSIPKNILFYSFFLLPAIYALSSFWSVNRRVSLMGMGFELDTLHTIALLSLFAFLAASLLRSKKYIATALGLTLLSFIIVSIFQVLRLFIGPAFLSLGAFSSPLATLVGSWGDIAILSGLFIGIILITLEILSFSILPTIALYIFLLIPFLFIAISNFGFSLYVISLPICIILALLAIGVFAYTFSLRKLKKAGAEEKISLAVPSIAVFIISFLLVIFGGMINSKLSSTFNLSYSEGRPSWEATFVVAKKVIAQRYIVGSGPGTFGTEWNLNKPAAFSLTDYWNTDFSSGVGFVPSSLVTVGTLGFLSWLLFLAVIFYLSYKIVFLPSKDRFYMFLRTAVAFSAVYLGVVCVLYTPGILLVALEFLFAGLVFSIAFEEKIFTEKTFVFSGKQSSSFLGTLIAALLLIGIILWGYVVVRKDAAVVYANKALSGNISNGDMSVVHAYLVKAISLDPEPVYQEMLAQSDVSSLSAIAGAGKDAASGQATEIQNMISEAANASSQAEALERSGFRSLLASGNILEAFGGFGLTQAYDGAIAKYTQAIDTNPASPLPYFFMARTETERGNIAKAQTYLAQALTLKQNFSDAFVLASQIAFTAGDIKSAQALGLTALKLNPSNFNLSYQIGLMSYNAKKYPDAVALFKQALYFNPQFANAEYFLALSLFNTGDKTNALALLNNLLVQNSDSQTLKDAIARIQEGLNPVASPPPAQPTTATSTKTSTKTATSTAPSKASSQ